MDPQIVGIRHRTAPAAYVVVGQGPSLSLGTFLGGALTRLAFVPGLSTETSSFSTHSRVLDGHDRHLALVLWCRDTFLWKNGRNRPNTFHRKSSQASRPYQYDQLQASCLRQIQTSLVGALADNIMYVMGGSIVVLGPSLNFGVPASRLTP